MRCRSWRQLPCGRGEDEELEQEYRLLSNGQKIMEALSEAGNLSGCGGYGGAAEEIGKALRCISSVQEYDSVLDSLGESLGEIESLLNDFNRSLSDYMDEFSFDAREQSRVEERLDLINRLKAKYGSTIQKILEGKKEREERLALLENYEEYLGKLEGRYEEAKKALERTADEIYRPQAGKRPQAGAADKRESGGSEFPGRTV